jgi:Domain of unknown function (DUF4932)/Bacterial Ig-like domain
MGTEAAPARCKLVILNLVVTISLLLSIGHIPACSGPTLKESTEPILQIRVDPRIELMSIIFRLAGNREYNMAELPRYAKAVDAHFKPFADHEAVQLAKRLRQEHGISYNAPMSMAIHILDIESLGERIAFDPRPESFERRWSTETGREFLAAAKRFVDDSGFSEFLAAQSEFYRLAEARMGALLEDKKIISWCEEYFGARPGARFVIDLGLLNGPGSYGVHFTKPGQPDELHSIIGVWEVDDAGDPVFDEKVLSTIVHEFIHSFVNPIIDAHADELTAAGEVIYPYVEKEMSQQAYGSWRIMIYETLVRGCTVQWLRGAYGLEAAEKQLKWDTSKSFIWMEAFDALLADYRLDRKKYPTFDLFMPRVIAFFDALAPTMDGRMAAINKARESKLRQMAANSPKIVAIVPPDGATDVDPALTEITITFDRAMLDNAWSVMVIGGNFPKIKKQVFYDESLTIFTMPVALAPSTQYQYGLNSETSLAFQDKAGNPLLPRTISFTTR